MNTNKEEMRELAALFYSVVLSTVSENEFKTSVQHLIKTAKDNHVIFLFLPHTTFMSESIMVLLCILNVLFCLRNIEFS